MVWKVLKSPFSLENMPLASLASARTLSFTRFSIFACCLFVAAVATSAQTVPLPYRPVTAEYSYGLDRIIFVTAGPNQLHIFDPISQSDTAVNLSQAPLSLSISPDGLHAAVGHNSLISYVNLQTASVEATYPSSFAATGVILATDYVYVLNPQGGGTVSIALSSGSSSTFNNYSGATAGRLHPSGTAFYEIDYGSIADFNISTGPISSVYTGSFQSYGPVCGGLWFSPDGRRIYDGCSTVYQASPQDTVNQGCCNLPLDTNADGLYWATLAGTPQIVSLNESAVLGRVAAIPAQTSQYATPVINDNQVFLYDSTYLDPAGTFQLPDFVSNGQSFQAHGKQVFYNQASTTLYVVMEADSTSGLLDDFAVQVFPLSNPQVCGIALAAPTGTVPATGAVATTAITAAAGCIYQASSDSAWIQFVSGAYGSGNGTLTYIARPNSGAARTGTVTIGSQSFTVMQAGAIAAPITFAQLGYSVTAAGYSKALDKAVMLVRNPKELHIYDPVGGSDQIVPLPKTPLFLSISPDGLSAAVGHDGWISIVNLSTASVTSTTRIFSNAQTLLLAGNGYVYVFAANANYELVSDQAATGAITVNGTYPGGHYPQLYLDGNSFYTETSKWDISMGVPQGISENYQGCAPFWLTEDGARLITSCGTIFTTSPASLLDLQPGGSFSNLPHPQYYCCSYIQWAVESENLRSTAVIPAANNNYGGTGKEDTSVQIYGDQSLAYSGDLSLPAFMVGQTPYTGHGRYAFWNSAEDKLIVLEQADSSADLLTDYGATVYSMSTPAAGCSFTLGSTSDTLGATPGQSIVSVATDSGCIWEAVSNTSWIGVSSGAGFGPGNLTLAVTANTGSTARIGTLTIGGQTFTVTQAAASSTTTATSFLVNAPSSAVVGSPVAFTVTALDDGGQAIPSYSGEIHFTLTDTAATPPANTTLNGSGTFSISLLTTGTQTITVNDVTSPSITGSSGNIAVAAASGSLYVPVTPCRVVDTRNPAGPFGGPFVAGAGSRSFVIPNSPTCGIPFTATAYSMNLTVVPHGTLGYVTMWPTGGNQPLVSTLNSIDGRVKANAAIVPAGIGGAISVFATNDTDVILDITGYFVPQTNSSALGFYPLTPCRLVDTRPGAPFTVSSGALPGGTSRTLALAGNSNCYFPSQAQAYSLNITAVPSSGTLGYLTVSPTGVSRPVVSTLNSPTGTVVANAAIVPAGTGGSIDVYATDTTDLVVDINGYFAPAPNGGGLSLYTLPPCRVLDTRNPPGSPPFTGTINLSIMASECGGTTAAQAYVLNATVVPYAPLGYLTLWPQGYQQPVVSTENSLDQALDSNMAIVPVPYYGNGGISAYASDSTQLILDTSGYFAP